MPARSSTTHNNGASRVLIELSDYINNIFPPKCLNNKQSAQNDPPKQISKRKQRRTDYAVTQKHWKKHQGRCISEIIDGKNSSRVSDQNVMEPYWRQIFEKSSHTAPTVQVHTFEELSEVWLPITIEESQKFKLKTFTAPGPDGITSRELRAVPRPILMRILNLIMFCECLPINQRGASTVFLPKKTASIELGDFRPITIPSVFRERKKKREKSH